MSTHPTFVISMVMALLIAVADAPAQTYQNIVVGEGCASICVDGHCELTCRGKNEGSKTKLKGAKAVKPKTVASQKARRELDFTDFSGLIINEVDADVRFDKQWSVVVTGDKRCVETVGFDLADGVAKVPTLRVAPLKKCSTTLPTKLLITTPQLMSIRAYGNANVELYGFTQNDINLEASDNVTLRINASQISQLRLKTDGNADVEMNESEIINADVMINDRSDVKLSFGVQTDGLLTGIVAGMSELLYCGAPVASLKVLNMADYSQTDCGVISQH